jgi:hypothetical protein
MQLSLVKTTHIQKAIRRSNVAFPNNSRSPSAKELEDSTVRRHALSSNLMIEHLCSDNQLGLVSLSVSRSIIKTDRLGTLQFLHYGWCTNACSCPDCGRDMVVCRMNVKVPGRDPYVNTDTFDFV